VWLNYRVGHSGAPNKAGGIQSVPRGEVYGWSLNASINHQPTNKESR